MSSFKNSPWGTSLVVQWLRLCASVAGNMDSIPGWGTKIPHATCLGRKKKKALCVCACVCACDLIQTQKECSIVSDSL